MLTVAIRFVDANHVTAEWQFYHLLLAVRGQLLLELGRHAEAGACFHAALERACSEPEQRFLRRRLEICRHP